MQPETTRERTEWNPTVVPDDCKEMSPWETDFFNEHLHECWDELRLRRRARTAPHAPGLPTEASEYVAETQLPDPHEPALRGDATEAREIDGVSRR